MLAEYVNSESLDQGAEIGPRSGLYLACWYPPPWRDTVRPRSPRRSRARCRASPSVCPPRRALALCPGGSRPIGLLGWDFPLKAPHTRRGLSLRAWMGRAGRAQLIVRDAATGVLCAGSDGRCDGCAMGY